MLAYSDPERTDIIQPVTDVELNDKIWVELKTSGLNENLVHVVTDSCWATSQPLATSMPRYDLIKEGCDVLI